MAAATREGLKGMIRVAEELFSLLERVEKDVLG